MEGQIGAARHERTGKRLNYCNDFRARMLDMRLGSLQLRIPKFRQGSNRVNVLFSSHGLHGWVREGGGTTAPWFRCW